MRLRHIAAASAAVVLVLAGFGCQKQTEEPALTPKVRPPAIAEEGVLRVGTDFSYPPFAGMVDGTKAGIDVDVAAAIAERLGCRLELVDVKPADMSAALEAREIDMMLGAVPIADAVLADVATAGSYMIDGPALFVKGAKGSDVETITAGELSALSVAAQRESAAYWALESEYGKGFATAYDTLKDAFEALSRGEVDVVAGDALVGAYIARDYPDVVFAGQFGEAQPLGISVRKDAVELEEAVREALDSMAADGVLETIRRKWVGDLPPLEVPPSGSAG